jgi:uncharacterized protein
MKKRIIGIDVARALAVFGMILVNFKVVFGQEGNPWLKSIASLFDGKAAATFVVLAGIGLALMTNSAVRNQDKAKIKKSRIRILKRAVFLFVLGLSYYWIWPADILHYYGIYMFIILFFFNRSPKSILIAAISLILFYVILILFLDYEQNWNFALYHYNNFWSPRGFFMNLFFNGFHPVIPWVAFMLFGLWFGKQDLRDEGFLKKSLLWGTLAFVLVQLTSYGLIYGLSEGKATEIAELSLVFGTSPMPPMPLYMLNGISFAVIITSSCILIANHFEKSWLINALNRTGQLALTFYLAHVIIGMGFTEGIWETPYGQYSIEFSVLYSLIFSLLCLIFADIWLRFKKSGPLEWVMRKLTD